MNLYLSSHAKDRLRQRVGIESIDAGIAWVRTNMERAKRTFKQGHKTHYVTEMFELVLDGTTVVTIKQSTDNNESAKYLAGVVQKEVAKFMRTKKAEMKKAEMALLEAQLNFLRAKNPNTKRIISERITQLGDAKAKVEDEIKAMELAAERFGV